MIRRFCVILAVLAGCSAAKAAVPDKIEFNRDVRPLLSDNCYFCHGPDKNHRKKNLRFDTKEGFFTPIEGDTPVVPGHPDKSEMFRRVALPADDDDHMPPAKSGKSLNAQQVEILKKWINEGAQWEGHWAYLKPVHKPVPQINDPAFVHNDIDRFIVERLKQEGLSHAPEANRRLLCRRVYLDLIGIPPTPQQIDAFVNDQSPNAYEKLVDQLLASPHFGERMAIYWLDLVRYADSIGYHSDNPRNVSPYRDYVIEAFNQNRHFDQFTIEQIAGDLLPNPTLEQKVASAYNRLLETTEEGGAQPKEYAAKYMTDRVRNLATTWLASTMMCCECHDHKFDPFLSKDFYSLQAFFADVKETPVGRRDAGIPVPTAQQSERIKQLDEQIAAVRSKLDAQTPEMAAKQAQWEKSLANVKVAQWTTLDPIEAVSVNGAALKIEKDGSILAGGKNPDTDLYVITARTKLKGVTAIRLEALTHQGLPAKGPGRSANANFVLTDVEMQARTAGKPSPVHVKLQNPSADFEQKDYGVALSLAKEAKKGWAILPEVGKNHEAVYELASDLGDGGESTITVLLHFDYGIGHAIGHLRLSATTAPRPVHVGKPGDPPQEILDIAKIEPNKRTPDQNQKIAAFFRANAPALQPIRTELASAEKAKADFLESIPKCMITMTENPRPIRILHRGNWMDDSGEIVQPAVPHFLPQPDVKGRRLNRLDLAQWLVSKENPLTARVFVNRLWKMYFGTGLSKNLDDLGSQGEWPTHPELLDNLAVEFMDSGWDIKHMVRLMVLSGTYRQASVPTKEDVEKDPFNRLLSHQSRFRLEGELVRDNALAIAGLLSPKIGGPSVKPYQPAGYWDYLNFPKRTWDQGHGEDLYRRSLYTWWQRTFLNPTMLAFDAPSREECTAQRVLSNTPQQALTLLNDPTFVEAGRVFAERIVRAGKSTQERIGFAFEHAVGRAPRPQEIEILNGLYARHLKEFQADPKSAQALISTGEYAVPKDLNVPELAAWTSVSRAILNLNETITRY